MQKYQLNLLTEECKCYQEEIKTNRNPISINCMSRSKFKMKYI